MNKRDLFMKKILSPLTMFLFLFAVVSSAQATLIYYNASAVDLNGDNVSGSVVIDDQIHLNNSVVGDFSYSIVGFNFSTQRYSFSGTSGSLYFPMPGPNPGEANPGSGMWSFNGSGDAQHWYSMFGIGFKYADGTGIPDANYNYYNLAPIIQLVENQSKDTFSTKAKNITLTQTTSPVPEPDTLALLGVGMLGILIYGKRHTIKMAL
jgi:hypothetical protein